MKHNIEQAIITADRHLAQPDHGAGQVNGACEVDGPAVASGDKSAEMFQLREASLDAVSELEASMSWGRMVLRLRFDGMTAVPVAAIAALKAALS